ncbi:FKBP-type peptidyl-prolyl cis-trans isomerase family protein [Hibiscus syriacus]|uniref:FKBP-type peptidyl-prolyl cis-trans isomerase family protein n=1 Tax=Hibiscus syriacus TaxID=106335 RepID=A0A6A3CV70_HIBSY|nr:FKBP-type peptidyl-prolyl cis-trans isomerase family protein [Hibiscus syriacus]
MSRKGNAQNKLVKFITIPFRALGKAKDLYVKSLTSCAASVSFGQGCGDYAGQYRDCRGALARAPWHLAMIARILGISSGLHRLGAGS